jgi:hypothetical protein
MTKRKGVQASEKKRQEVQKTKQNAAQQLKEAQKNIGILANQIKVLAEEIDRIGHYQTTMFKRSRIVEKLLNVSDQQISAEYISQNVAQLEGSCKKLEEEGILVPSDKPIGEKTFLVYREIDPEGNVINPRTQTSFDLLNEEYQGLFRDKKKGDILPLKANGNSFELFEVYEIHEKEKEVKIEEEIPTED